MAVGLRLPLRLSTNGLLCLYYNTPTQMVRITGRAVLQPSWYEVHPQDLPPRITPPSIYTQDEFLDSLQAKLSQSVIQSTD